MTFQILNILLAKPPSPKPQIYQTDINIVIPLGHAGNLLGQIDFCLFGQSWRDDRIRFTVENIVFYNNTLYLLPIALDNLNLQIANFTKIEIAHDNYYQNTEQILRRNLRNKENTVKLLGRKVLDRNKSLNEIGHYHHGSLNNPFKQRTIYIKNKKETFGLKAYDKKSEIENISPDKGYILECHKKHNPNYWNIYRTEINWTYEEIRRFQEKLKRPITLSDCLDNKFLYAMFSLYMDRILLIRDSNNQKIEFLPKPNLECSAGILQPTLPEAKKDIQPIINKEIIKNKDIIKKEDLKEDIYKRPLIITINTLHHEKESKTIGNNQTENQQCFKGQQQSQLW